MKKGIHPGYRPVTFTCTCGNVIETYATNKGGTVEICSSCHPFYTGKQKLMDTAGRVERFKAKYKDMEINTGKKKKTASAAVAEEKK